MIVTYEVRSARGCVVKTFCSAAVARKWLAESGQERGAVALYAVETIRRERDITDPAQVADLAQARKLRRTA